MGLAGKADAVAGALPVLDRKLLMLAGAMATRPKLLLMDEPVGGLTSAETDLMMETVRRIKAQGVTIILIEHVMRFLVALSDRVMILHHGERIYDGPAGGLVRDQTVVDVYLGEGASARLAAMLTEPGDMSLLEIEDLEAGYGAQAVLHGLSLAVGEGSFAALVGPNGHGKSTALRVISGLLPARAGTVRLAASGSTGCAPTRSWRQASSMCPRVTCCSRS